MSLFPAYVFLISMPGEFTDYSEGAVDAEGF